MIFSKFSANDKDLLDKARQIRHWVFVKEQGVDESLEFEGDNEAVHFLLSLHDQPIAAARYRQTPKGIKLERFAVLPNYRNSGVGTQLLRFVMQHIDTEQNKVYLHSQLRAVPYYQRNGFVVCGDVFYEAGMPHYLMEYKPESI